MIIAKIYRDKDNNIKRYTIEGHANYGDYGGDIVCAAISVLSQNTLLSLIKICGLDEKQIRYTIDDEGYIDVELTKRIEERTLERTQTLLESLELGIKNIIESYPENVALEHGEV